MKLWGLLLLVVLLTGCTKSDSIVLEPIGSEFCDDLEKSIWQQHDALDKSCEEDFDCSGLPVGCPIPCLAPINKNVDLEKIKSDCEIFYEKGCTQTIYAKCTVSVVGCIDNVCTLVPPSK